MRAVVGAVFFCLWLFVGYTALLWLAKRFFKGRYRAETAAAAVVVAFALGVHWPHFGSSNAGSTTSAPGTAADAPLTPHVDPARTGWNSNGGRRQLSVALAGVPSIDSVDWIQVLVNSQKTGISACYAIVYPARKVMSLADNAGRFPDGAPLGSPYLLRNTQCEVDLKGAAVRAGHGAFATSFPIAATDAFTRRGILHTWIRTEVSGDAPSDWIEAAGPAVSFSPHLDVSRSAFDLGTGRLAVDIADSPTFDEVEWVQIIVGEELTGLGSCYVTLQSVDMVASLVRPDGNGAEFGNIGKRGALENANCGLDLAKTTVRTLGGRRIRVSTLLRFAPAFAKGELRGWIRMKPVSGSASPWYALRP